MGSIRTPKYGLHLFVLSIYLLIVLFHLHPLNVSEHITKVFHSQSTMHPYIAVIVDDRATQKLVDVVINVLQHIPTDWKVQIFTHTQHWSFYKESILSPFIINERVFMTPIDFPRNNMSGGDFINLLLTSATFWHRVQGDKVLYFQIDSVICSNSSYKLTDFLHYDFIGAPWAVGGCCNGGFSIRSRTRTLQLLENPSTRFHLNQLNEDGWYTDNLPRFNSVIAPVSIAKTFSVETIYHLRPFAVHKPLIGYLGRSNMNRLCDECPETRKISSDCQ